MQGYHRCLFVGSLFRRRNLTRLETDSAALRMLMVVVMVLHSSATSHRSEQAPAEDGQVGP